MTVRIGKGRPPRSLLETAAEVLAADPAASLADVAAAAGIGRTTLHKRYPSRHDLLVAVAGDALDHLEAVYRDAGLDAVGQETLPALRSLVTALVPLGSRLVFLTRERSLDTEPELIERVDALDDLLREWVRRAQTDGVIRSDLPDDWVTATVNALVNTAWELIALGRLAPQAAPTLVMDSLLHGAAGESAAVEGGRA